MGVTQYDLDDFGQMMVTGYSSQATLPADSDPGSQVGAILNAPKVPLGLVQQQVLYLLSIARLATIPANADGSPSQDLISYVTVFGITPLPKTAATGNVTFSTPSNVTSPALIPVGVIVQTSGGVSFTVQNGGTGYDPVANGYWIAAGTNSVVVPVLCSAVGTIGNVQAGTITQIVSGLGIPPISVVASVTNAAAFTTATNGETHAQLLSRFTAYVSTGTVATKNALIAAITGVQANLTYSLADGINASGAAQAAFFTVVVNVAGSSTTAPGSLLTAVATAVDAVRAAGIQRAVIGPTMLPVQVTATVKVAAGYSVSSVSAAVTTAVENYINGIGLDPGGANTTCALGKIYAVIYGVPGVAQVDTVELNGGTADVIAGFATMLSCTSASFTMTS